MIIINKDLPTNEMIVTVSETNVQVNPSYQLVIDSDYTNKSFSIDLPANTSSATSRYDLFVLQTSAFTKCEIGLYNYKVIETTSQKTCEQGLLKVLANQDSISEALASQYITIPSNDTDDDYTVMPML